MSGLVLLDMPDHDSRELAHRVDVDRLVDRIDLIVWVVDPQKYADEALHADYLRRLRGHDDVLIVVLNQVDRLSDAEREAVMGDLRRLVREDGLPAATVMATSTVTGEGVQELRTPVRRRGRLPRHGAGTGPCGACARWRRRCGPGWPTTSRTWTRSTATPG